MVRRILMIFVVVVTAGSSHADTVSAMLQRAQNLAYAKKFDEAASVYEQVLREVPSSRDAQLGLARVRLWQGRYPEARQRFQRLLARNPGDADAAEGAATAAYWSGDYRTAAREFQAIATKHPQRETVRRSLAELRSASATTERIETGIVDDDQPFRSTRTAAGMSVFTDPLTRWDASAGGYTISSDVGGRHAAPFAILKNETVLPSMRLTITPSIGAIRTPDHRTHAIGGLGARYRLSRLGSVSLSFTRREMLSNATRLYPFVDAGVLRWEHSDGWLASIGVEHDRFSDRNSANAADAYVLWPVRKIRSWTFSAGASMLSRDTDENRFYVTGITAVRDPSGSFFHYTYRGAYDPYWTPLNLIEGRLILAIDRRFESGISTRLQVDGGRAHDRALGFFPDSGTTSFPTQIGQIEFGRSYSPWRIRFTSSVPVAHGMTLEIGVEHGVTAFYRANTFHAALARRL